MARTFSSQRLRKMRRDAGLTAEQSADRIGRSIDSIRSYECGRVRPPVDVLGRLASLYSCEVSDFYDDGARSSDDRILAAAKAVAAGLPELSPEKRARVAALLGAGLAA